MTPTLVLFAPLPDAGRITTLLMRLALVAATAGLMGFCSSSDGDGNADSLGGSHSTGAGHDSSDGGGGGGDGGGSD